MKRLTLFLVLLVSGCASAADVVQPVMVISPKTIVFSHPSSDTTLSITHTCSCPFSWNSTVHYSAPFPDSVQKKQPWVVLGTNFPANMSSDHPDIHLSIDRTMLMADTSHPMNTPYTAVITIISNSYGVDSILVTAIK